MMVTAMKMRTWSALAAARKDVQLETTGSGNDIDIYVDGPFRCQTLNGDILVRRKGRQPGDTVRLSGISNIKRRMP